MAKTPFDAVLKYLRRMAAPREGGDRTDTYLLQRFAVCHDEVAFEGLLQRHLAMVWSVCQRVLRNRHDAEDACQATFLVLLRKAGSLRRRDSLGTWLYTVAYRVALRARAEASRRRKHECRLVDVPDSPDTGADTSDLRSVLDAEMSQLPEKYRAPLVYCYLEGKSYEQAARLLGWTVGTFSGRLARGRELLKQRLIRRGLTLSAATLAPTLAQSGLAAAPPLELLTSTVKMANVFLLGATTGEVSDTVALLVKGTLQTMFLTKAKIAGVLLGIAMVALAAGVMGRQTTQTQQAVEHKAEAPQKENPPIPAEKEAKKALADRFGDPLPLGAIARLGTLRWRVLGEADVIAFAPDGKTIAVASRFMGTVSFFDVDTGRLSKTLGPAEVSVKYKGLSFSPDGTRLAHYGRSDDGNGGPGTVQIWDLTGRNVVQRFQTEDIQWLGWSSDNNLQVVILEKEAVLIRELETGNERRFKVAARPRLISYATQSKLLAVSDQEDVIRVWDATTGEERCTIKPEGGHVRVVALSSDGRALASHVWDGKSKRIVQLWDIATGKATHAIATGQKGATTPTFTPDGRTLATISWHDIRFWNVADGRECGRTVGVNSFADAIAFSSDGKTLATTEVDESGVIHLWDVATGFLKSEPTAHTNRPVALTFSADGRLASGGMDCRILLWDLKKIAPRAEIRKGDWVRNIAFSPDGQSIFSCWTGNTLYCSDTVTGADLGSMKLNESEKPGNTQLGLVMRLSDDGKTLVAVTQDSFLLGWDAITGKQIFRRQREPVETWIRISPDCKLIAVGENGTHPAVEGKLVPGAGPFVLEDGATGERLLTFPHRPGQTWPAGFSPDGRLLVASTSNNGDATLRVWEIASANEVLQLPIKTIAPIAFSSDSRHLAVNAESESILIWDLREGRQVRHITGFGNQLKRAAGFGNHVQCLAFSPDGRFLASGHRDTTLLIWALAPAGEVVQPAIMDANGAAQAWKDLTADAITAFAARGRLADSTTTALTLLKERLKPAPDADVRRIGRLIADLGNDNFAVRQKAQTELEDVGELAKGAYKRILATNPSLEMRQRIEGLLQKLRGPVTRPETLRAIRAVAVLEDIGNVEARKLLETLAEGEPEDRLTQDARASLLRLERRAVLPSR